jgi:hypothetical protein
MATTFLTLSLSAVAPVLLARVQALAGSGAPTEGIPAVFEASFEPLKPSEAE